MAARTDRAGSWALLTEALEADLADTQGGTTREGVHLGAMAGTADMVMRCYGGVETRDNALWLHPALPDELNSASFELSYRGQPVTIDVTSRRMHIRLHSGSAAPIRVCAEGMTRTLGPGQVWEVALGPRSPARKDHRRMPSSGYGQP
ncbi:hypothetical protein GCM10022261_05080 [Brevibacterium daeguense]|uniref:Glycoside hydrolase family 65 C-terminal domain-containing protein n=1 Tax=Brevibacterium daeguense TaxID=909936 RepID=A0ABP8EG75_9MICO